MACTKIKVTRIPTSAQAHSRTSPFRFNSVRSLSLSLSLGIKNIVYKWAPIFKSYFVHNSITFIYMINGREIFYFLYRSSAELRSLARKFCSGETVQAHLNEGWICRSTICFYFEFLCFDSLLPVLPRCFFLHLLILSRKYEQCFGLCTKVYV